MSFRSHSIEDFKSIFATYGDRIRSASGCVSVDLLQDSTSPHIFFTYSKWEHPDDLERYRQSELFGEVWAQTKALFSERAEAWSVNVVG